MFPKYRNNNRSHTSPFLRLNRLGRGRSWVIHSLLALSTALFCAVAAPIFSHVPVAASIVQTQPNQEQLVQQGKALYESGQFADAATVWQQAASVYQTQADNLNQSLVLSYLCLAYQQLGQWDEARVAIANSLNLLQVKLDSDSEKNRLPVLAQALNTQGSLQLAQGQAENALTTWQQATATYKQVGDEAGIIGSRINQAQALQTLGLYRQANKTLTEVEQVLQNQSDSLIKVTALRSLGNALRVVGDLEQSRKLLQQSLAIAQQLKSPTNISAILLSLGNTTRAQSDTKAAWEFYQQAVATSTTPITRTQSQLNQLSILLTTQQLTAAQTLASQIQPQLANLPASRMAIYAQINFARSLVQLRQACKVGINCTATINTPSWVQISQLLTRAIQQAKSLNDKRAQAYALGHLGELYEQTQSLKTAQTLTEQALLIAQAINASDIAYRWQWQLGRLLKAQGNTKSAIAAYTEAVNTLQLLRSDLVTNPEVQFSFREEVEPVYRQLADLLLQSPDASEPSQENLVQARILIESLQLAELDNFFRVACLQGKPVLVDQVIDQDDPTAAVIYPIILPDRLEVILKLPKLPLRHYRTAITQEQLEQITEQLQRQLPKPYTQREIQALSQQIYSWLLKPAEADLAKSGVKTLVFVLDSALRNVPMAVLYDGQQYLIQKYSVALAPGLQLLAPKSLAQTQLKALTGGLSEARQGFPALINVRQEVKQIQSEVPSTVLLDQQFTSTALQKKIQSASFPVVHLATHGQFSSKAEETFILTWDGTLNVKQLGDALRDRNPNQPQAIELLVLSACQTAQGDKRAALGLAGVAVRAGARSTLATLWSVDDESSAVLMSQFYRVLANTRMNKAEALRQAQLALLKNPRYQRPHNWAPYVLVGNWL